MQVSDKNTFSSKLWEVRGENSFLSINKDHFLTRGKAIGSVHDAVRLCWLPHLSSREKQKSSGGDGGMQRE